MNEKIFQKIELTGTSSNSLEDAIQNAIARATKLAKNLRWFEVVETRGAIEGSKVSQWQVTVKVGFALDE